MLMAARKVPLCAKMPKVGNHLFGALSVADAEALLLDQGEDGRVASDGAGAAADLAAGKGGGLRVAGGELGSLLAGGLAGALGGGVGDGGADARAALLAELLGLALEQAAGPVLEQGPALDLGLGGLGLAQGLGLDVALAVARGGAGGGADGVGDDVLGDDLASSLAGLEGLALEEAGAAGAGVELEGLHVGGVHLGHGVDAGGDGQEEGGELSELHLGGVGWLAKRGGERWKRWLKWGIK
ncbi:hypothetical protein PG996_007350 [Apiospora saccharicola]|uniref:Uncharacterized protein n=1 Tax=Apiospora saccharicola TaxID=335842 RepID=A0ABR1VE86_9PEZI